MKSRGKGDDRGQDGWTASLTQWTWVWASSRRWWRTGKPGCCSPWGCRVGHNSVTGQQQWYNYNHKYSAFLSLVSQSSQLLKLSGWRGPLNIFSKVRWPGNTRFKAGVWSERPLREDNLCKLMSIESVMPSNHFILCRPLLLLPSIFPSIRVFSNESAFCIRWPK